MARPNRITIHPNLPLDLLPMQLEADDFLGKFFRSWYIKMIKAGTCVLPNYIVRATT